MARYSSVMLSGRPSGADVAAGVMLSLFAILVVGVFATYLGFSAAGYAGLLLCCFFALLAFGSMLGERYELATVELMVAAVYSSAASTVFGISEQDGHLSAAATLALLATSFVVLAFRNIKSTFPAYIHYYGSR